MVCNNCGKIYDDNMAYCPDCGTPASQQSQQPYQQYQNGTQADPVYQMPNYQMPNYQMNYEKPVSVGKYIGWMLIGSVFGPISIIISIIFACMSDNKSRANFFRAHLVMWAIGIAFGIIIFMVMSALGTAILSQMDSGYQFYDEFLSLIMRLRF